MVISTFGVADPQHSVAAFCLIILVVRWLYRVSVLALFISYYGTCKREILSDLKL